MKQPLVTLIITISLLLACKNSEKTEQKEEQAEKPNIVLIYMDDLGYGDVSAYGMGTLRTPNIDRIAEEGILFTNGYATSATCTPSRYAILSGEYPWRNERAQILPGNAPLLFDIEKPSMPRMLQGAGYKTAVIGKWHLGLGGEGLDWNGQISPGPNDIGFDYSFILASTNDRVPSVYIENDRVADLESDDPLFVSYRENFEGEPTGKENPELLKIHPSHGHNMSIHNGISRIGYMKGGKTALFIDENMSDTILARSKVFIAENQNEPFFLFFSLHQPHVPRVPHPRFEGSSGMGPRGDAILEADWATGQLLDYIEELGLKENTIILFSSDNGPVLDDGYIDQAEELIGDHSPRGIFRGGKYSLFEAGTRVPFIVSWPRTIETGTSDALVCQLDYMGSLAALLDIDNPSLDSKNTLEAFVGKSNVGRQNLVLEARSKLFYREGDWVLIPPYKGSPIINKYVKNESGLSEDYQLYNLKDDPSERNNLAQDHLEMVQAMEAKMLAIKNH